MSLMCFFLGCRYEREPAPARRPVDPLMTVKMLTALADERERKRAAGLKRIEEWIPADRVEELRAIAAKMRSEEDEQ